MLIARPIVVYQTHFPIQNSAKWKNLILDTGVFVDMYILQGAQFDALWLIKKIVIQNLLTICL